MNQVGTQSEFLAAPIPLRVDEWPPLTLRGSQTGQLAQRNQVWGTGKDTILRGRRQGWSPSAGTDLFLASQFIFAIKPASHVKF